MDGRVFYLYSGREGRLYRSGDGGVSWARTAAILPAEVDNRVRAAPGLSGTLCVSLGRKGLHCSRDGGQSFSRVAGVQRAYAFDFGKNAAGKANPNLFVYGTVGGISGLFRSQDLGASWIRMTTDAVTFGNEPNIVVGDRQQEDRVFVGTNGHGILYAEPKALTEDKTPAEDRAPAPGPNLLKNGGFEFGLLGWGGWGTAGTTSDASSGLLALKLGGDPLTGNNNAGLEQSLNMEGGTTYTLSFDARLSGACEGAGVMIVGGGSAGSFSSAVTVSGTAWQSYLRRSTTPASVSWSKLRLSKGNAACHLMADNLSVVEGTLLTQE